MLHVVRQLLYFAALVTSVSAASADQWRGRSIYQIITDRYALPSGSDFNACDPKDQTWCGGTWNTIRENLDYIQNAGFTAIWISPVSQNYEGPRTAYGDAYHGYWIADVTKLNDRFGTSDDLKALSDELHRRGMYLMVDVVVNNVMATSTTPDLSTFLFQDESQYHTYCPIDWTNDTSIIDCWLGDTTVTLPDVNTQDPDVVSAYQSWITGLVQEYNIDGLRIDAAKHVNTDFWPKFCGAGGVFCIGEVFDDDVGQASQYQGTDALDSILNYPIYDALVSAFTIPGALNISALTDKVAQSQQMFKDTTLLGNFLEDQDVPRWGNLSVDPQSLYNAMVYNWMSDGIPILYYGQEQGFHGNSDPYNREPLWPSGYANTTAYQLVTKLNTFRNFLVNGTGDWATTKMEILTQSEYGLGFRKGNVVTVLTNIGSPPKDVTIAVYTPWEASTSTTEIISCEKYAVGSNGTIFVDYSAGGRPAVFMPDVLLNSSGVCGFEGPNQYVEPSSAAQAVSAAAAAPWARVVMGAVVGFVMAVSGVLVW
ncbi:glycoside hydrolase family 13 protein [Daedalea quercina L-15889]|uniref:alpha-amylase n=1 Tax=Daedalea quercina L-15889 TaxID=1314783 RepID=A0A165U1D6_9APHY|nr:glycoside hydrolase family 13 protein [Daedalea quercina L-15889]